MPETGIWTHVLDPGSFCTVIELTDRHCSKKKYQNISCFSRLGNLIVKCPFLDISINSQLLPELQPQGRWLGSRHRHQHALNMACVAGLTGAGCMHAHHGPAGSAGSLQNRSRRTSWVPTSPMEAEQERSLRTATRRPQESKGTSVQKQAQGATKIYAPRKKSISSKWKKAVTRFKSGQPHEDRSSSWKSAIPQLRMRTASARRAMETPGGAAHAKGRHGTAPFQDTVLMARLAAKRRRWWVIDTKTDRRAAYWDGVTTSALVFTALVTPFEVRVQS